jgi:hypothetical protein
MRFYDVPVNRSVPTEANRSLTSYKAAALLVHSLKYVSRSLLLTYMALRVSVYCPPKGLCILSGILPLPSCYPNTIARAKNVFYKVARAPVS